MDRRKLTMNWDGLAESNEDDLFFDTYARISSAYSVDLHTSRLSGTGSGGDDEIPDNRLSFASCVSSASAFFPAGNWNNNNNNLDQSAPRTSLSILQDYGVWIAEPPSDITERRRRLLQGMGLMSRRINSNINIINDAGIRKSTLKKTTTSSSNQEEQLVGSSSPSPPSASARILLVRSRSDGDIEFYSLDAKKRKEELIGPVSKQRITRTSSVLIATNSALSHHPYVNSVRRISEEEKDREKNRENEKKKMRSSRRSSLTSSFVQYNGSFFLIKDLDSGKEFVVKESNENGSWNKLSDLETGKQLTMEEFEKSVGFSPFVKELMRRENIVPRNLLHCRTKEREQQEQQQQQQLTHPTNSYLSKSFRYSKKRGVALLKNIKEVANSMGGLINNVDKERESFSTSQQWVKVRHHGKSQKDLTALYYCQEIQAHQGSIWTIKFSSDARYLASAGEDRVIRVWEVQECDILSPSGDPMDAEHHHHPPLAEISPMHSSDSRRKMWRSSSKKKRSNPMPDYVNLPDTVFALCERPVCTFEGHLEDVLDLSWSREHLLLSSSMDKTVRLWDLETESCLKLFAHNDYVTCIQFNPAQDDYFISGSLDSKVRIWNVTHRQVVDWIDLHEMVTAASYTPDGQGAIVGTRKGNCRVYKLEDCRLELKELIELKKKKKSQVKKVTGIQCSPCFPDEVLITSADSRIRIFDGSENTHKFKGLKNSGSQISASYTPRGKFIVSASEDNQVFIWEREEPKISVGGGGGKGRTRIVTNGYEQFHCRDVSVAIPWPGSIKHDPPLVELHSKRHLKRTHSPRSSASSSSSIIRDDQNNHSSNNKREYLPPLPHHMKKTMKRILSFPDQTSSRIDPGIGTSSSLSSSSSSVLYDYSPSRSLNSQLVIDDERRFVSSSSSSSSSLLSLFDGGGGHTVHANAWGLVIVTASLGGEIRVYQNFGLPFKVSRVPIPS